MTLERLLAVTKKKVKDSSFNDVALLEKFNTGLVDVAGRILLPDLATLGTVKTSLTYPYVDLPAGYHRDLHYASSAQTNGPVPLETSFYRFIQKYPLVNQTGAVECVAVRGKQLYYQGKPSTQDTLTLLYYRLPTLLDFQHLDAEPVDLPPQLHEALLANYAAWQIFTDIEDGLDGPGFNTKKYAGLYLQGVADAEEFVGAPDRPARYVRDDEHRIGGYY